MILGSLKDVERWNGDGAEGDHPAEEVKELGRSKWSDDLDEDDAERTHGAKGNLSSLSGLIQAYGTKGKSIQWGDQVGNTGFAIGAAKKAKVLSLVIGPGAGYNLVFLKAMAETGQDHVHLPCKKMSIRHVP